MSNTVIAVLKENESELQSWLKKKLVSVYHRLVVGETVVLGVGSSTTTIYSSFIALAGEKFWAYNIIQYANEYEYWPNKTLSVRFDYQGNMSQLIGRSPSNTEVRQVLHQLITLEPNDPRLKDRLFNAYLLRFEWENQLENGRLHAMRKLIGGL
jgi:hypothetical protein